MKAPSKKKPSKEEKPLVGAVVDETDQAEVEETQKPTKAFTESGVEIVDEISGPAADTKSERQAVASQIAVVSESENLDVVFLEELNDYPVIGGFNFRDQFGIAKIRKHQRFTVPKNVAMVLLDRRLVTVPQFSVA